MTHRYTLLVRGTVISGGGEPDVSAIAWAEDTVLALGSDDDVRAVSRGDSHVIDLAGACVVPLGDGSEGPHGLDASWTPEATLEVGGRADLAIRRATRVMRRRGRAAALSRWRSSAVDVSSPAGCRGTTPARRPTGSAARQARALAARGARSICAGSAART